MECIALITSKIIKREGGNPVSFTAIVDIAEYNKNKDVIPNIRNFEVTMDDNPEHTHLIFDYGRFFNQKYLSNLLLLSHEQLIEKIRELNNVADINGNTLAHWMAWKGVNFSASEIISFGNPANNDLETIAHDMARNNHIFSVDEINQLEYQSHGSKRKIADIMVEKGYNFSVDDLLKLDDFRDKYGTSVAHLMILNNGYRFTIPELLMLKNVANIDGETLAHWMAHEGYEFTEQEISMLGNPLDINGKTIDDWITRN